MFLLLAACEPEATACDTMAAYSVNVTVDAAPADIESVTYAVDGVDKGDCDAMPDGVYACGIEVAGHFVITATVRGYQPTAVEVDVAQGECHVVPESITLQPQDCETAGDPSILVELRASDAATLVDPQVLWIESGGDVDTACVLMGDIEGGTQWTCGDGNAGDFVVTGLATGYEPANRAVTVPDADYGCGVETQTVELVLDPAG